MTTATRTDAPVDTDRPEQLVVVRQAGPSMLERWVDGPEPEKNLARVDAMAKMLERLRLTAIQQTYPTDWVIHTTRDADGNVTKQVGYLQDSGAERAGKVFGILIGSPEIERDDLPDGTYIYKLQAEALSQVTHERIEHCLGSRWSGDTFFARQVKDEDDKVDPTDVMKAAYANLHGRAVRALAGLSAVPLDALEAAGINTRGCTFVGYDKGARGGQSAGATVGSADVKVGFGRSQGKSPAELEDKDLDWYLGAYEKNVADPERAKFRKANGAVLAALKAEKERRAQGAAHEQATGTKAPDAGDGGETGKPTTRGQKVATLNTLLIDAAKDQRKVLPLLRTLTKDLCGQEIGSFQDLSEEQLDKCLAVDPKTLEIVAQHLDKAAAKK